MSISHRQKFLCFLVLILSSSLILFSCSYSKKNASKLLVKAESEVYDVIVVPGLPFQSKKWDRIMRGRIYWAKYLYDRGIAKNIIFSGSSVYTAFYEGKIMALYAEAIGIPKEHVFSETRAEHSTENIYYSYQLAKKLGFNKIALASDPFQTRTLKTFARRRCSRDIAMIPMVIDTMKNLEPSMANYIPIDSMQAFNKDFISIEKRQSKFKRMLGTLGYNIREEEEEKVKSEK